MKDRVILHISCTGLGGSFIEPGVPNPDEVSSGFSTLIAQGFPIEHVVLRTDPLFPNPIGLLAVSTIWSKYVDAGVRRIRYSYLDRYPHVKRRFERLVDKQLISRVPYQTKQAPQYLIQSSEGYISDYANNLITTRSISVSFESCAEKLSTRSVGCISNKDLDILKIPHTYQEVSFSSQRTECKCLSGKIELLPLVVLIPASHSVLIAIGKLPMS